MANKIPKVVNNTLLHVKDENDKEQIILPFTRYDNVMGRPRISQSTSNLGGSPFSLLHTSTVTMSAEKLRSLVGDIV